MSLFFSALIAQNYHKQNFVFIFGYRRFLIQSQRKNRRFLKIDELLTFTPSH